MPAEIKRQKELFEAWAGNAQFNTERVADGSYWSEPTHVAHRAWLAACEANGVGEPSDTETLRQAAVLARNELRWMLRNYPHRRGGSYEEALNALESALAKREERG